MRKRFCLLDPSLRARQLAQIHKVARDAMRVGDLAVQRKGLLEARAGGLIVPLALREVTEVVDRHRQDDRVSLSASQLGSLRVEGERSLVLALSVHHRT